MPGVIVEKGLHSANKDHTAMTGGTLSWDKIVQAEIPVGISQYALPVGLMDETKDFFAGIHSLEHALAYSRESGSLRATLSEHLKQPEAAHQTLDISPYLISNTLMGFRLTFVGLLKNELDLDVLIAAYLESLKRASEYFQSGNPVPFSSPRECGQYDLHSNVKALELAQHTINHIQTKPYAQGACRLPVAAQQHYVGDLRLVKPRPENDIRHRVLDPLSSHILAQIIETYAPSAMPTPKPCTIRTGNFGCGTGEYLIVSNPNNLSGELLLEQAHVAVARVLMAVCDVSTSTDLDDISLQVVSDAALCLDYLKTHSPEIIALAETQGPLRTISFSS